MSHQQWLLVTSNMTAIRDGERCESSSAVFLNRRAAAQYRAAGGKYFIVEIF
jgi:hypothetical protein